LRVGLAVGAKVGFDDSFWDCASNNDKKDY